MSTTDTNKKIDVVAAAAKRAAARIDEVVRDVAADAGALLEKVDDGARKASLEVTGDVHRLGVKAGEVVQGAAQQVGAVGEELSSSAAAAMKKTRQAP